MRALFREGLTCYADSDMRSIADTELVTIAIIKIRVDIIRSRQAMFDADLAEIYGYEVRRSNEQVKRDNNWYPEDFMFQLTADEIPYSSKPQVSTLNVMGESRGWMKGIS